MKNYLELRKKPIITEYIGVILLLFVSRSVVLWAHQGASFSYTLFFAYSLFLFIFHRGKVSKNNSLIYATVLVTAVLANRLFFNPDASGQMWLAHIFTCVSSLLFFSSYNFNIFKKCLLDVLAVILAFSIPLHLIDIAVGIPGAVTTYTDPWHSERIFLFFKLNERLQGIWGEPGVTQIFINTTFLLYIPEIRNKSLSKSDLIKLVILLIALLLGISTTGFLVLAVLVAALYYSSRKKLSTISKVVLFPVAVLILYFLIYSPAVQDKFSQDRDAYTSYGNRYRDNIANLRMALDRPFTGYGMGTSAYSTASDKYENLTSSNGVFAMAARIGFWWLFLYVPFLIVCIKKYNLKVPLILSLTAILMMEFNEDFIEFPFSYLFLMNFGSYSQRLVSR